MRPSVAAAWPAIAARWEGRLPFMYLDVKGKVTTGVGNLIDTVAAAQSLPWLWPDGKRASGSEVMAEWERIRGHTERQHMGGQAYEDLATLRLGATTVEQLFQSKTAEFWAVLTGHHPAIEEWPADAQLAALDLAWQNGPHFTVERLPDDSYRWPNMRAAFIGQDWLGAARAVPGTGDRADFRVRLFGNAAAVVKYKLPREKLWNETKPTPPKGPTVQTSARWGSEYVSFRGGYVPPVCQEVLAAIPSPVELSQGGLSSSVAASANTHAGLGAYDIKVKGWSRARILTLCAELIRSGECAFPRGGWFGSAMFVTHVHVASNNAYGSLHPEAQAQVRAFKNGRDGLARNGRYVGPKVKLGSWRESPYNPRNRKPLEHDVMYVDVKPGSKLLGLNVDRKPKLARPRGYRLVGIRQTYRWGRWNLETAHGTFYAMSELSATKPK